MEYFEKHKQDPELFFHIKYCGIILLGQGKYLNTRLKHE